MSKLTIGKLAQAAGVHVETIRFYQRKGLLAEPARPLGGVRGYGAAEVARVRFIKSAQRLGFTLDEIAQLLRLADGTQCVEARTIAEQKLAQVRARLSDLRQMETALLAHIQNCATVGNAAPCPLIDALQGDVGAEK